MDACRLVIPDSSMLEEIRAYRQAFLDSGDSMDGTGCLRRCENPAHWLRECELLARWETTPEGRVPATQFVCLRTEDRKIVGMLDVRHAFNEYLEKYGGHIGYSVRPDERRRGYASQMLRDALGHCKALGLDRGWSAAWRTMRPAAARSSKTAAYMRAPCMRCTRMRILNATGSRFDGGIP